MGAPHLESLMFCLRKATAKGLEGSKELASPLESVSWDCPLTADLRALWAVHSSSPDPSVPVSTPCN